MISKLEERMIDSGMKRGLKSREPAIKYAKAFGCKVQDILEAKDDRD